MRSCLESAGYQVDIVTDPLLFHTIPGLEPDMILLDINMPGVLGDKVAQDFKKTWGGHTPIYLFSDIDEDELKERAVAANADGYMCKGWGLERVAQTIQDIVGPA